MKLKSSEWKLNRQLIEKLKPALSYHFNNVSKNAKETAKAFNVSSSVVYSANNVFDCNDIKNLYGEKRKEFIIVNQKDVFRIKMLFEESNIKYRLAEKGSELLEKFESKLD